jgi:Hint domain
MNHMLRSAARVAAAPKRPAASQGPSLRPDGRPQRMVPLMRKIEVACLAPSGSDMSFTRLVPALPAFDETLAAFSRSTLMSTDRGLVAVEDLWPGDQVRTVGHGFQPLLWKSSTLLVADAPGQDPSMGRITRIMADGLGIARPMPDLVLGPRARLVHRAPGIARLTGADAALIPVRDFIDGQSVIDLTPLSPVPVFHLGFAAHERLVANGVEVESFHPGPIHRLGLRGDVADLYLSLFPHIQDLEAFGAPCLPRLRLQDLDLFAVA